MRISCQTCTSAAGQYQKSAPVVSHPDWFCHLNLLSGNGIWSCLFFHLGRFPGLGVVGNKFGTKHVLMCLHSATACTECPRASPGSSRSEPHRNGWAPGGSPAPRVPLRPLFSLILPIFPPVLSILSLSLCLTFFDCSALLSQFSPVTVKPLLNATTLHSRGWAGIVGVSSDSSRCHLSHCWTKPKHQHLWIEEDCPTLREEVQSLGVLRAMWTLH